MFLGINFIGVTTLQSPPQIPSTSSYDKLTIYGQGKFDKVWIRNRNENWDSQTLLSHTAYLSSITSTINYTVNVPNFSFKNGQSFAVFLNEKSGVFDVSKEVHLRINGTDKEVRIAYDGIIIEEGLVTPMSGVDIYVQNLLTPMFFQCDSLGNIYWLKNIQEKDYYYSMQNADYYTPVFDSDTVFLAEFNNNLSAGNFSNVGGDVVSYKINKKKINNDVYDFVTEIPVTQKTVKDYRVQVGQTYTYQILPITSTIVGQPIESANIVADYYGWFLIDETVGLSYKIDINVQSGTIIADSDQTEYQTLNKYNTISQGIKNFIRGTASGIIPEYLDCNGVGFIQSADFITQFQDFINNGNPKLLKSRKGDIWKVMTSGFSRSQWVDELQEQIDVVSFNFIEIEDVTNY